MIRTLNNKIALPSIFPMALLLLCLCVTSPSLWADGTQRSRAEAVEIAKQRSGNGKVLSVRKTTTADGASVYAVKIISNGRVKVYRVREFGQ